MSFRIRFIIERGVEEQQSIPEPLFGRVVWESENATLPLRGRGRSRSMDMSADAEHGSGAPTAGGEVLSPQPLSKSAEVGSSEPRVLGEPSSEPTSDEGLESVLWFSGNPEIEISKGVLKLFRDNKSEKPRPDGLPAKRSDLLAVLAVPAHYNSADICRFLRSHLKHVAQMRVLRDQSPDRLMLVVRFTSQELADAFYMEFNGARFNSVEPECCKVAFLSSVEFLEPREGELMTPVNQHELPSCPVCLERLEEQASGLFITLCNHSFHCSCLAQWNSDSSCPVCRVMRGE